MNYRPHIFIRYFNKEIMKKIVTVETTDAVMVTIFTQHITHIDHANEGCIIYLNSGNPRTDIKTKLSYAELIAILEA